MLTIAGYHGHIAWETRSLKKGNHMSLFISGPLGTLNMLMLTVNFQEGGLLNHRRHI